MRETATYRFVKTVEHGATFRRKKCGACKHNNPKSVRVCRQCYRSLVRAPKKPKPARGSMARVAIDLKVAAKNADAWTSKAKRAMALAAKWHRRERMLAARLQAGPQPPKPKKPKPTIRAIKMRGATQGGDV